MAQNYECVLIVDPALSEEAVQAYQDQFSKLIADRGGEVVHVLRWGKRRLTYPIERKREAIYLILCFRFEQSAKDLVEEFERQVRINDDLLREMTVKVPEFKIGENPPPEFTFRRDMRSARPYRAAGPSRPAAPGDQTAPEGREGEEEVKATADEATADEATADEATADEATADEVTAPAEAEAGDEEKSVE